MTAPTQHIQRLTWRDGQALTSTDLNDTRRFQDRLRGWHNLYMHNAARGNWGIVDGFEAALVASLDSIAVTEGYALDSFGRTLILSRNVVVPVPLTASGLLVLAIRYQEDGVYCKKRPLAGACEGAALGSSREFPAFVWLDADEYDPTADVAITAAHLSGGKVLPPLISLPHAIARPVSSQKYAQDVTAAFETTWSVAAGANSKYWFETKVSTEAAGFVRTPLYFVDLRGPGGQVVNGRESGIVSIEDAQAGVFTVRVLSGFASLGLPVSAKEANQQAWVVAWIGFEPIAKPPALAAAFLHLSGYEIINLELFK